MKEFEQFQLFLIENNVLDRYIKYADMEKEKSKYTFSRHIRQMIDWAFIWSNTDEGRIFWEELDKKWLDKCVAENISCICTIESIVNYLRNNIELWED